MGRRLVADAAAEQGREPYEKWVQTQRRRFAHLYPSLSAEQIERRVRSLLAGHCAWSRTDDPMTAYALSIGAVSEDEIAVYTPDDD